MVVMDALVGSVLFVEFKNFVVFANGSGPVVDVVFIKDNNGVALAAGDSSCGCLHSYKNRMGSCLLTGRWGGFRGGGQRGRSRHWMRPCGKGGAVESGVVVGTE